MKLIAFETSGRRGTLAAAETKDGGGWSLLGRSLAEDRRSAQTLAPALASLLAETGWGPKDLDAVAVASGPGSFTGLRVGVTAAKMLAFLASAPVVEVNTLQVIARQGDGFPIWAVMDAQRNELFATRFDASPEIEAPPVGLLHVKTWISRLRPGESVTGPGLVRIPTKSLRGIRLVDSALWSPSAETVARIAIDKFLAGQSVEPERLVPRYHRLSAAEEKRRH